MLLANQLTLQCHAS